MIDLNELKKTTLEISKKRIDFVQKKKEIKK